MACRTRLLVLAFVATILVSPLRAAAQEISGGMALEILNEELAIADIMRTLEASAPDGPVAVVDVRIVDPEDQRVSASKSVIVDRGARGRIVWIGETKDMPSLEDLTIVDGGGRFLAPGLVDMHVHVGSMSDWLLNLANGVTAIREMDGFPWMLSARQSIGAGRMLGPALYVAGTIINAYPMWGYAAVPANSADARRIVREQAACGYDFIKTHNLLPQPMFDAVVDQAHALGMDVVGHVPHEIELGLALHAMRTTEHLKGFLHDETLLPNDADFKRALKGAETWITPTLYIRYDKFRGEKAQAILDSPAARYVPARRRAEWRALIEDGLGEADAMLAERHEATQDEVMRRLLPLKPRWLAGTDAAGYAFNIMGFALIEELGLLRAHGLSPADALKAATSEPAHAMRQDREFGRIAEGMRADFVLLDANPLEDASAYAANAGVMTRGRWLSRDAIDEALSTLAEVYGDDAAAASPSDIVERTEAIAEAGYVFAPYVLEGAADALGAAGKRAEAARLRALVVSPSGPPCDLETPQ